MTTHFRLTNDKNTEGMARAIETYLEIDQNMETQIVETTSGEFLVQGRTKNGKFKQFIGLDRTISVRLIPTESSMVTVEIGNGKWVDKSVTMLVSMFVLWPLAVTSGAGFYKQSQLPKQICAAIRHYLES